VVETHSAVLLFLGDRVYKLKKPVDLGFLDFSTREEREAACHAEVDLNRRLAPDAYLGVVDVLGLDGRPADHLVVMRRMPEERRLARLVHDPTAADDVDRALRTIAHDLAALHEASSPDTYHDRIAGPAALRARWLAGFEQLADAPESLRDPARDDRIEHLVLRYLDGRTQLFEQRIRKGRIRDGHGDLLAEDIFLLPEGPQVLDCLEFAEDYRWGDVLLDAAFLAMDLERLGRPDLGERFLALHREHSADRWPRSLAHHYIAYRAHVRAKVGVLRAEQAGTGIDADTDALFAIAQRHLEAGRVRLTLVGGAPGTGKTTVAEDLADRIGAVVLHTDEVRARRGALGDYRPGAVHDTYEQLFAEARRLLALGEQVVVDATLRDPAHRAAARQVALQTSSDLVELRCVLDPDLAARRVAQRLEQRATSAAGHPSAGASSDGGRSRHGAALGGRATALDQRERSEASPNGRHATELDRRAPSEATPGVARRLAEQFAAWPEAVELDTTATPERVVDTALAAWTCPLGATV
jgi:aminoglycoside phosphotransferase family enzyme/predicted kinase